MRLARVDVGAGRLRVWRASAPIRAANRSPFRVERGRHAARDARAKPGRMPQQNVARASSPVTPPPVRTDDERVTIGAGAFALGRSHNGRARALRRRVVSTPSANALIVYARAIAPRGISPQHGGPSAGERFGEGSRAMAELVGAIVPTPSSRIAKVTAEAAIEPSAIRRAHRTATGSGIAPSTPTTR